MLTKLKILSRFGNKAVLALALFSVFAPVIASAQSNDVSNRLNRIEREIETLSRSVYRGEAPPAGQQFSVGSDAQYQANLEVRLNALEEQLRNLTGQIEENRYRVDQLERKYDASLNDINMQLNDQGVLPQNNSTTVTGDINQTDTPITINQPETPVVTDNATPQNPDAPFSPEQPVSTLPTDAATLYEKAFSDLKSERYQSAQTGFEQFLNVYSDNKLAANARYWLAETFYVQGNYDAASKAFATAYQKDPEGNKASDNLLKLGLSLDALDRDNDACVAYKQLLKAFGPTNTAIVKRAEAEIAKLSCN